MYAILFMLLSAATLIAQPWEVSLVELTPQPYQESWSQVHVLPISNGETALITGKWDYLPPLAVFDSLGVRVRGFGWPDELHLECSKSNALDLSSSTSGFGGLFNHIAFCANFPPRAFCWLYDEGFAFQTVELSDTTIAIRAAHDGTISYFLCNYRYSSNDYFVTAASDYGEIWRLPLSGELWVDRPLDFCLSTGYGVAYVCYHDAMETAYTALRMINSDGEITYTRFMHEDSIYTPVKVASDALSGCWAIGMEDPDEPNTTLYLYYSEDHSYHTIPLGMTLPPYDGGAVPTLHAIPFANGIMIAGTATLDSGEDCLFTLTYSSNGAARIDTILGYTRMLDISSDDGNNYVAAVRAELNSDIVLLRARSLISPVNDPSFLYPSSFILQVYPNPFNAQTTIQFDLPRAGDVTLKLFDLLGREVETLLNERINAGAHTLNYNATSLPSGVYFARLVSGELNSTHKLLLLQ